MISGFVFFDRIRRILSLLCLEVKVSIAILNRKKMVDGVMLNSGNLNVFWIECYLVYNNIREKDLIISFHKRSLLLNKK